LPNVIIAIISFRSDLDPLAESIFYEFISEVSNWLYNNDKNNDKNSDQGGGSFASSNIGAGKTGPESMPPVLEATPPSSGAPSAPKTP
jgi:hypothetical protein